MTGLYATDSGIATFSQQLHPDPELETWGTLVEFSTWVVFSAQVGSKEVWAWCLTGNGPGFRDVVYSNPDGRLDPPVDIEQAPGRLDKYLFTHTCPVESV